MVDCEGKKIKVGDKILFIGSTGGYYPIYSLEKGTVVKITEKTIYFKDFYIRPSPKKYIDYKENLNKEITIRLS